LPDRHRL